MNVWILYEVGGDFDPKQVYDNEKLAKDTATEFEASDGLGTWGVEKLLVHTETQSRNNGGVTI